MVKRRSSNAPTPLYGDSRSYSQSVVDKQAIGRRPCQLCTTRYALYTVLGTDLCHACKKRVEGQK